MWAAGRPRYGLLGSLGIELLLLCGTAAFHQKRHHKSHPRRAVRIDYTRDIKPILMPRGYTCHGPARQQAGLRRVWIDLIGLPPTRAELQAFLADRSESAYERAVDRLLASPQYGERWGRHWMDVWRYSDPDGRKAKQDIWWSNVHLWRWRDWIVKSL